MKTKELRLGNIVNFMEDDTIFTVDEIVTDGIGVHNEEESTWIEIDQFSGIPLTEEWLLKFGFTFNPFDKNRFDDPNDGGNRYHIMPYKTNYVFRCVGCSLVEIKYVHQLQNLFYYLTEKELEVVNES